NLFMLSLVILFFVFFFQAEDGIRDLIVTGVQTCALPIYLQLVRALWRAAYSDRAVHGCRRRLEAAASADAGRRTGIDRLPRQQRSEERRVGKEWRCRGSA